MNKVKLKLTHQERYPYKIAKIKTNSMGTIQQYEIFKLTQKLIKIKKKSFKKLSSCVEGEVVFFRNFTVTFLLFLAPAEV